MVVATASRACRALGIEPMTRQWDGKGDPIDYVISKNLLRRHLNESQRGMVADKIATLKREDNLKRGTVLPDTQICGSGKMVLSQTQAAEMLNIGVRTVQKARTVRTHGSLALQQAVEDGTVSLNAAAEVALQSEDGPPGRRGSPRR